MPRLKDLAVELNPQKWKPSEAVPAQPPVTPPTAPVVPEYLAQNRMMLGSLPAISTNVSTGSIKQFYGGRALPRRQVSVPGQ